MTEISPMGTGAATARGVATKIAEADASASPRPAPDGERETAVHADPTPLAAATSQPAPFLADGRRLEHTARIRSEISGTGGIVDVVA